MQSNLKTNDQDFKKLEDIVLRKREDELLEEVTKHKQDREHDKIMMELDEGAFSQLLQEVDLRAEREFQVKVEREGIRKQMGEIDSWKMSVLEEQRRTELDRMLRERDSLHKKQVQLIEDIGRFMQGHRTFTALLQSTRTSDNKGLRSTQYSELKQKLVSLSNRRDGNESDRNRIQENLERLRLGDLAAVRRGQSSASIRAAESMLNEGGQQNAEITRMRDKLASDADRLAAMRSSVAQDQERAGTLTSQSQKPQTSRNVQWNGEVIGGQGSSKVPQNAEKSEQRSNKSNVTDDFKKAHQGYKQQIDQLSTKNIQLDHEYTDKVVTDLDRLRIDYTRAGGNDPQFLQSINNLENFYNSQQQQTNNNNQSQQDIYNNQQQQQTNNNNQQQYQTNNNNYQQQDTYNNQNQQRQIQQPGEDINKQDMQVQVRRNKKQAVKDPFNTFSRSKEFFLSNNERGVDLTREEQIVLSLSMQEVDALRAISRVPVGTEIYRFKMEQFKELSTTRAEIEKVMQEQRLQRLKQNFEKKRRQQDRVYENNKWVDDHRRYIIDSRVRNDFQGEQTIGQQQDEQRTYDPTEGLVIHWDYAVGLPRRTKLCQFIFAIYNNMQQQSSPKLVDPVECEVEGPNTNRVLYGESNQVLDVAAHPESLLIVEVQFPVSQRVEDNIGRTNSWAWTHLDLFDQQRSLKRGKFKCPLYIGPTDPAITIEEIAKLEPIPNAWLHLRITFPNDEELGQVRSIYPEQTQQEYNIPQIHLRGLFARNYESVKAQNTIFGDVNLGGQEYNVYENVEVRGKTPVIVEQRSASASLPPLQRGQGRGISIAIHTVINHVAKNHVRVMAAMLFDGILMIDDLGLPVAFNTSIHDPTSSVQSKAREGQLIPLTVANGEYDGINNKSNRTTIITYNEEYRIFHDMLMIAVKSKKTVYLGLQLVEKQGNAEEDKEATFGEFQIIGWQLVELIGPRGEIQVGRQALGLYPPPFRVAPFDSSSLKLMQEKIEITVNDFVYSEDQMLAWRGQKGF